MLLKRLKNKKGFSLLELAFVVGFMAIISLGVGMGAKGMGDSTRVITAVDSIENIYKGCIQYLSVGNTDFSGVSISALTSGDHLPSGFDASSTNPFGGTYSVSANSSDSTQVDISLTSVNASAQAKLDTLFGKKANSLNYDSGTQTWTATF